MSDKKSFIMYLDWAVMIYRLTDDEAGQLLKALYLYIIEEREPDFSGAVAMAFDFMSAQIKRDTEKYHKICDKRSKSVSKRYKSIQKYTNVTDTDTDTVTDTVTDTDTDTDTVTDTEPQSGGNDSLTYFNQTMNELFKK